MSKRFKAGQHSKSLGFTVSFGEHFQKSDQFTTIFKEGMALVEKAAAYLDGRGRRDAKQLRGAASVSYATESMRLTTRLLELASWLLIRRAARDGEIDDEEARRRRQRIKLGSTGRPSHIRGWADLPTELQSLIEASAALQDRILKLDRAFPAGIEPAGPSDWNNPVASQLAEIEKAFGQRIRATDLN